MTKRTKNRFLLWLLAAALGLTPAGNLYAQTQPDDAENRQDEVVTIHLDPDEDKNRVLQILRSGDKFETNQYVSRAFELEHTSAFEIRPFINDIVSREKGFIRGARTVASEEHPSREFVVVTTTPAQMESIAETIRTLDVPGFVNAQGRSRQAIRVRYRRASDLAHALSQTRGSSQTRFFADDLTNTLYYDDSAFVMQAIEPFVTFFDVPAPQIEFDVQIVEIKESNESKLGLDWDAWKQSIGGQFALTGNQFEGGDSFVRLDSLLTLDANVLANFLNYTTQSGTGRLVQRSRLNASNLEPAVISDIKRVTHYDYERTERTPQVLTEENPRVDSYTTYGRDERAEDPRVVTTVAPVHNRLAPLSEEHEGLLITIQPVIGTETVTATINIALNTVTGFDRRDRPILTQQELQNLFTLQNGEQILLGTLERNTVINGRRGIPGLKEIPVVKYLFSVESERVERSRLFILATPSFSNVRFSAASLRDLQTSSPLQIEDRTILLEDGRMDEAINLGR